jgi:iron(III) transport system permease protein
VQTLTLAIFTTWLNRSGLGSGGSPVSCCSWLRPDRAGTLRAAAAGFTGLDRHPALARRIRLAGGKGWLAAAACLAPVALGFLVPLGYLAHQVAVRRLLIVRSRSYRTP